MKYDKPSDIPASFVKEIKKKKTYRYRARQRASALGIPLEELPDDEWREIWWKRAKRAADRYRAQQIEEAQEEAESIPEIDGGDSSLSAYLEFYADPAPNDIVSLKRLVSMERQAEKVESLIEETLESEEVNATRYKRFVDIQKSLSTEIRLLQDSLGISRKIRDQQRSESELADHLRANITQARELMSELGVKLYCPHCRAEKGTNILNGFFVHHFPEMGSVISTRCPDCGREYEIKTAPHRWERRDVV